MQPITSVKKKSNGVFRLFSKEDIKHRMGSSEYGTGTGCKSYIKKLPDHFHFKKFSDVRKINRNQSQRGKLKPIPKRRGTQLIGLWYWYTLQQ
ncbi:hypothetical protein D1013_09215 [Euzebyella marina]|uniref:Uncharacterized protein n=1 Tax=Euzebyella marina TaxID=1761453 RepID=A0A3G2L5H5_9FLAO|nr:hypothetical protein D1013_09215 [Euzebyella marina]